MKKLCFLLASCMMSLSFAQETIVQTASLAPVHMPESAALSRPAPQGQQDLGELAKIAEQFLADKTRDIAGKAEITVSVPDSRLKLSACDNPVPYLSQGAKIWGKTTVAIRCEGNEGWRVMLKAQVKILTEYLAAAKALPQGHIIRESDLALVTGDITAMRSGVLTDREHAVGKSVVRSMQPGAAIWPEQLRAAKAIQQGQSVRIISRGPGFQISGEGHAINSAGEGQVAKARMPNGSIVRGIARETGIIEVTF